MKCQILFSGKNKKNIIYLLTGEQAQRVVKVKYYSCLFPSQLYNINSNWALDIMVGMETHMDGSDFDAEILPANILPEHKYQIFHKV